MTNNDPLVYLTGKVLEALCTLKGGITSDINYLRNSYADELGRFAARVATAALKEINKDET